MDFNLQDALRAREQLLKNINQKDMEIIALKDALRTLNSFIKSLEYLEAIPDTNSDYMPHKKRNRKKEEIAKICYEIISIANKPLSRLELFAALKERGIEISGGNPEMVLSTMLWRMSEIIVKLGVKKYWLADKPYPELSYMPNQSK